MFTDAANPRNCNPDAKTTTVRRSRQRTDRKKLDQKAKLLVDSVRRTRKEDNEGREEGAIYTYQCVGVASNNRRRKINVKIKQKEKKEKLTLIEGRDPY